MNNSLKIIVAALVGALIVFGIFIYRPPTNTPKENISAKSEETAVESSTYGHVHALFRNPNDGVLLMGTHHGLFRSTDEGKTFVRVETKAGVMVEDFMNFAYDPTQKILYAGGHNVGVVKSLDGGNTWSKADNGIKGTDIHALVINPLDGMRLYAFSVDNGVFGTKDGAISWYRIDDGPVNPSVRAFGYMGTPSSMDRSMGTDKTTNVGYLWAGTSGGLYSSFACFCGWTKTAGIPDNATIYTLAPDPVNKSRMLAGTRDGIWKTIDEGKTFTKVTADISDIAAVAFDLAHQKIVWSATSDGAMYKSVNGGETWGKIR